MMSSFRNLKNNCKLNKKTLVSPGRNQIFQDNIRQFYFLITEKRMSFIFFLHNKRLKASMSLEAAIAVPFFLFFLMNILFAFDMLRLHGNLTGAMHQVGNKMAFYGYAYKNSFRTEELQLEDGVSVILSEGYARNKVIHTLGEQYLNHTCLSGGVSGLHFIKSSIMKEDDKIELIASYKVKPLIGIMGFPDISMENRYYGRAWTGYDVKKRETGGKEEDWVVYIAENGTVYHMARNCAYLNPSIEAVSAAAIGNLRNEDGERYHICGSCKGSSFQAVVYVTSYGNKVHSSLNCPGLKRTIYAVPLSETEGREKCSKCGG